MKLAEIETRVDTSKVFESQHFAIGDVSIILEILRSKIYSNPIHIICQEIMSNARDAHRELGKPEVPIQVIMPNSLEDTIQFRDFGPGITPDRMANVFIQYGRSTKRDDNLQTGGFGLGAKTPFSYSDSFAIISITPDETGQMIKRQYVAYIDETRMGTMSLTGEEPTQEPQGTTIIVTPKPGDLTHFRASIAKVASHWDVKPEILPEGDIRWPAHKVVYQGTNWKILDDDLPPEVIIDGIPYPLDKYQLVNMHGIQTNLLEKHILLFFKVGEIKITAGRESIDYQPEVKKVLYERFRTVHNDVKVQSTAFLASAKNLWEAALLWNDFNKRFSFNAGDWNGCKIERSLTIKENHAQIFRCSRDRDNDISVRLHSSYGRAEITYSNNCLLIEDDTGNKRPSKSRLASLFDKHPNLHAIYVARIINRPELDKSVNWSRFEATKLSTIPYKPMPRKYDRGAVVKMRRLDEEKNWEPCSDTEIAAATGGVYIIKKGGMFILGKTEISKERVESIADRLGDTELYYTLEKYVPELGSQWVEVNKYVTDKIAELEADQDIIACEDHDQANAAAPNRHPSLWTLISTTAFIASLKYPDGICGQYIKASTKFTKLVGKVHTLRQLRNIIDVETKPVVTWQQTMQKLAVAFENTYPLVIPVDSWRFREALHSKEFVKDLIAYINVKDEEYAQLHQNTQISNNNP